jgi:hypothetical protein
LVAYVICDRTFMCIHLKMSRLQIRGWISLTRLT